MKTGMDILRQAMNLLGYTNSSGEIDAGMSAELYRRGLPVVNQIYAETWPLEKDEEFQPLSSIGQEVPLSMDAVETVMPYGVAMLFAQADGDGANQQFYATLYQQKRNYVHRPARRRRDVLPKVWED